MQLAHDFRLTRVLINGEITVLAKRIDQNMIPILHHAGGPVTVSMTIVDEDDDELHIELARIPIWQLDGKDMILVITGHIRPRQT